MTLPTLSAHAPSAPPQLTALASRILANCLDIVSLWSIGHDPDDDAMAAERVHALLAFADKATLQRLRRSEDLHDLDIEFLVVIDGDLFESAWGPSRLSGSLARWAAGGGVVRTRRKALLVWQSVTPN